MTIIISCTKTGEQFATVWTIMRLTNATNVIFAVNFTHYGLCNGTNTRRMMIIQHTSTIVRNR